MATRAYGLFQQLKRCRQKWSLSLFRANFDRKQGLTDVNSIGFTGAIGIADRFELFGMWRFVRLDRDVRPTFVPGDPNVGGVTHEYPPCGAAGLVTSPGR